VKTVILQSNSFHNISFFLIFNLNALYHNIGDDKKDIY
jgi:hypothetical protein